MKKTLLAIALGVLFIANADAGRGRQPCSGSKGGISHCTSGGQFVCNDGTLSRSKKFCSGYGSGSGYFDTETSAKKAPSASVKKPSRRAAPKKVKQQPDTPEKDALATPQPPKPTCAPLYMANKPGYTQLPICSGNQF